MADMLSLAGAARRAAIPLAASSLDQRNQALLLIAESLYAHQDEIFAANERDLAAARGDGLAGPLLKRLSFPKEKLDSVVRGLHSLRGLGDPIGHTLMSRELSPGLDLYRVSCPIGVVGVIFESRPDALIQIASLCLKSGNAVLLKGGREALKTNRALYAAMAQGAEKAGIPSGWAGLMESRADVSAMLKLDSLIDLIIPRGSNAFVRYIMENSRIPVLGHADGVCHVYVDRAAELSKAVEIAVDSKTQAAAVCNAMETLLVHRAAAGEFLPALQAAMGEKGVCLKGCEKTREIIDCLEATEDDWRTEYLDLVLSIRVVEDESEAIRHINAYGSGHTDAIVTEDPEAAKAFLSLVDSAGVYWNCSTRFADGFRYGFGAEVGIATGKLHARGPMGLEGLCTYKYKLLGHGQTVASFQAGERVFTHRDLHQDCPL